jgi:signal transduction histidine kinase
MKIGVVSHDESLYDCVCAILGDLPQVPARELTLSNPLESPPDADLYIWDYSPEQGAPWRECNDSSHHLLLVNSQDLVNVGVSAAGMMLTVKPFDKRSLSGWLAPLLEAEGRGSLLLSQDKHDRQWSDFMAKAVHDFKSPLTAASGYCGLLLDGELGALPECQSDILSRIQKSLARLERMTSEVLDRAVSLLKKEQSPAKDGGSASVREPSKEKRRVSPRKPQLREGELGRCIEHAIHEVQLTAAKRNIRVTRHLMPAGQVYFDEGQVEQVLSNLLENACKFTTAGGRIEIRGYPHGAEFFRVDVFNTGPGISPGRLNQVFDEYTAFGNGSGTGLGLAISKRIVEQHGGRIWAENEPGGPKVSFVLPVKSRSEVLAS